MTVIKGQRIDRITGRNIRFRSGDTLPAKDGEVVDQALDLRSKTVDVTVMNGIITDIRAYQYQPKAGES